ncbi:MAG TPA: DNA methyltransferase [bacterium]|nr:DNA methyltransferase [bacterium]
MADGNTLYYGDNLEILRRYIADESVDLIYLDPPFNSAQDYNVLFKEQDGSRAASQIKAFEDTWRWDEAAALAFQETVERGGQVSRALLGFRSFLGDTDMLAYLSMMAPRLVELRRVLKPTGSIYMHCDPTASHYLKMLMDSIFGPDQFLNEIIWQRSTPKGHAFTRYASSHDVLLFYARDKSATRWNPSFLPHNEKYLESHYNRIDTDNGRRYRLDNCLNPNPNRPNLTYEWNGLTRVWRWTKERMQRLHDEGRLVYSKSGMPQYKRYLDEMTGTPVTSVWTDIPPINSQAAERLGYPTQKPEALLERILSASCNEGDTVLDPFCGCGTTIAAAQKLKRRWIGIDITHLAITLIRHRLHDSFGDSVQYKVIGEPVSVADAQALAVADRFQFQWWALGLVDARPIEQKRGADQGIDGRLYFHDEGPKGTTKQIILSVKSGGVSVKDVRDLRGVIDREKAAIGVLITLEDSTKPMRSEAASAGFYNSPWGTKHPVLQILTIEELLDGKGIDYPHHTNKTFKQAPRKKTGDKSKQGEML